MDSLDSDLISKALPNLKYLVDAGTNGRKDMVKSIMTARCACIHEILPRTNTLRVATLDLVYWRADIEPGEDMIVTFIDDMMNRQMSLENLRFKVPAELIGFTIKELTEHLYAARGAKRLTERLYIQIEVNWKYTCLEKLSLRIVQLMQMLTMSRFEQFMLRMKVNGVRDEKDDLIELIESLDIGDLEDTYLVQYEVVLREFSCSVTNKGCDISVHIMNDTVFE